MVLKTHISPVESPSDGKGLRLEEINDAGFDIAEGLKSDTVYRTDNWLVANKTQTWALMDLMIVYCGEGLPLSFSDLGLAKLKELFAICSVCVSIIRGKCPVSYIGANINHSLDPQSFSRLHLHTMGFTREEIADQVSVSDQELAYEMNLITDSMVERFALALSDKLGAKRYEFGLTKELKFGPDEIKSEDFCREIKEIDEQIKKSFGDMAYSFCLKLESDKVTLNLVPRSVFGKGVLESDGIILRRTDEKKFTKQQLEGKLEFVSEIRRNLENIFGPAEGAYINNLAKRIKGENYG